LPSAYEDRPSQQRQASAQNRVLNVYTVHTSQGRWKMKSGNSCSSFILYPLLRTEGLIRQLYRRKFWLDCGSMNTRGNANSTPGMAKSRQRRSPKSLSVTSRRPMRNARRAAWSASYRWRICGYGMCGVCVLISM